MDPGLLDRPSRTFSAGRTELGQRAFGIATNPYRRVHQRDIGDAETVHQHRHRVHQHARLVGDDLQGGTEPGRIVGGSDRDERLPGEATVREPLLSGDQRRRYRRHGIGSLSPAQPGTAVRAAIGGGIRPFEIRCLPASRHSRDISPV